MPSLAILVVMLFAVMIIMLLLDHKLFIPLKNSQEEHFGDYPLSASLYDRFVLPTFKWMGEKYLVVALALLAIYVFGTILEAASVVTGIFWPTHSQEIWR